MRTPTFRGSLALAIWQRLFFWSLQKKPRRTEQQYNKTGRSGIGFMPTTRSHRCNRHHPDSFQGTGRPASRRWCRFRRVARPAWGRIRGAFGQAVAWNGQRTQEAQVKTNGLLVTHGHQQSHTCTAGNHGMLLTHCANKYQEKDHGASRSLWAERTQKRLGWSLLATFGSHHDPSQAPQGPAKRQPRILEPKDGQNPGTG